MAISAILQIVESGGGFLKEAFDDTYTVLNLDYSIERSCDKTGRPTGGASISCIYVTIRAAKEKDTPFHKWIKEPDFKMDGKISIFDSTGLVSSTVQDVTGSSPLLDINEIVDIPDDMMAGAMGAAMDNASDYGTHDPDIYDEMSHKDLVDYAIKNDISIDSSDTDEVIRGKIRNKKKVDKLIDQSNEEVEKMSLDELKTYVKNNQLTAPTSGSIEDYKELVKKEKEKKIRTNNKYESKDDELKEVQRQSFEPAYKAADTMKGKTVNLAKTPVKEATRRLLECARNIAFKDAYCISLKEHFNNAPDSQGKLDKSYPWTIELGIKPKKVSFSGTQLFTKSIGSETEFELY